MHIYTSYIYKLLSCGCSVLPPSLNPGYQFLCQSSLSIWTWVLYKVSYEVLVSLQLWISFHSSYEVLLLAIRFYQHVLLLLLLKMLSFLQCVLFVSLSKSRRLCRNMNLVWILKSISSICVSVFIRVLCYFYYYSSVVWLKIRGGKTYSNIFIVQNCFDYSGSFVFPYESWDYFSQYLWGTA